MPSPVFLPGERDAVDAVLAGFVAAAREAGYGQVTAGTPFQCHARRARKWLAPAVGRPPRQHEVAALLLDWARGEGDVRLYAYQPIDHWFRTDGAGMAFAPDLAARAAAAVAGAGKGFVPYARALTRC